jgi:urease accessory protein
MKSISKLFLIVVFIPGLAFAHTGVGETSGMMHGFYHPFSGLDHLLAMLAVGIWGAQLGDKMRWALPVAFLAALVVGGGLGFYAMPLPYIEEGILVSVLVLGMLIASKGTLSAALSMGIVGLFALFHGYAHGAEMPVSMGALSYTIGFTTAAALIISCTMAASSYLQKDNLHSLLRIAGSAITVGGVYLALA